jgi:hypothetical protein
MFVGTVDLSWAYQSNGQKTTRCGDGSCLLSYGLPLTNGDIISCILNLTTTYGTVEYYLNGRS